MLFDFKEKYRDFSTVDLLLITLKPDKYQADAVKAATELLGFRTITDSQRTEAEKMLHDEIQKKQSISDRQNARKETLSDLLAPILTPQRKAAAEKWLRIFVVIIILQYLWDSISNGIFFARKLQCRDCEILLSGTLYLFDLAFTPFIIYLLVKRKKWGWILLLADGFFMALNVIPKTLNYITYSYTINYYNIIFLVWYFILYGGLTLFLCKDDVMILFDATLRTKRNTLLTVLAIFAVFYGIGIFRTFS